MGHHCPSGAAFAEQERTAPKRMLTTTVRAADGQLIPVRTKEPIAKEKIFDAVKELRQIVLNRGDTIHCGDIIAHVADADGTHVPVLATAERTL